MKTTILPQQIEQIEQRIKYNETKIDKVVYELYDLTAEEKKIIN
jgi:hypothetical protein